MDAVLDRRLSKVLGTHVEPRVPGANFIGAVEDVAKALVNDVAESYVDVLSPVLKVLLKPTITIRPLSLPCIGPHSIVTPDELLSCLSLTPSYYLAFFLGKSRPKEKSSENDNSLNPAHNAIFPVLRTSLLRYMLLATPYLKVNMFANSKLDVGDFVLHTKSLLKNVQNNSKAESKRLD